MLRRIEVKDKNDHWQGAFREMYDHSVAVRTINRWHREVWEATPAPNERIRPRSDVYEILFGTAFYYTDHGWSVTRDAWRVFFKEMCKAGKQVRVVTLNDDHGLDVKYEDRKQQAVIPSAQ